MSKHRVTQFERLANQAADIDELVEAYKRIRAAKRRKALGLPED